MLNVILSCLIVHYILVLITKPKLNTLYCGLFGYVGIPRSLDKKTFCTLGLVNDTRGGDSTGIFIDREVEYGVLDKKLFANFYDDSDLFNKTKVARVALGHCRKASVGAIGVTTAQPVVIRNRETDEIEFVLLHNGTLLNHKELAAKYLKGTPDTFTDSQIMAHIMYFKGYEVLKEYYGAGAFVMVDYRKNKESPDIFMFKGESLNTQYAKEVSEERPLYISIEDRGIWFSSIPQFLETTRYGEQINDGIRAVKSNHLYHIKNGVIKSRVFMDRSKKHQTGAQVYSYGTDYERFHNRNVTPAIPVRATPPSNFASTIGSNTFVTSEFINPPMMHASRLIFVDGFYYLDNKKAHGKLTLNPYGYKPTVYGGETEDLWFYSGVLLFNEECFKTVTGLFETFGATDMEEYVDGFPETVYQYSPQVYYDSNEKKFIKWEGNMNTHFTGTMGIVLDQDDTEYTFVNGTIRTRVTYNYSQNKKQIKVFKDKAESFKALKADDEIERMCKLMNYFEKTNDKN